ncbi:hypothetical protein DSL72_003075 [Monilinia vaccinii-corymbosi]|uniref:Uncharacterized protein n=1 Tax=Monilinia vaccinii-corymbosi TaxID=61207 RepID=A0A8A3P8P1_9HELO|nr:hypothetical protein DSL72_003075 [Monilinia vaccinii-corymbosi]
MAQALSHFKLNRQTKLENNMTNEDDLDLGGVLQSRPNPPRISTRFAHGRPQVLSSKSTNNMIRTNFGAGDAFRRKVRYATLSGIPADLLNKLNNTLFEWYRMAR